MKRLVIFAAAFAVFASTVSYAGLFSKTRDLSAIFEDLETNNSDKAALDELEAYAAKGRDAESGDEALLRLAFIYSQKKELNKAARAYQKVIEDFPASRFKYDALYGLGEIRYRTGSSDAKSLLEAVSGASDAPAVLRAKSRLTLKRIELAASSAGAPEGPAIGVLLPLKGGYAQFGEDALSGVLLAAEVFGGKGAPFEVIVKNVGSDPAQIEEAVNELADNPRVAGIVGPLVSSTSLETVRYAQKKKMPVITMSQRDGITQAGEYVFRNSLTPQAQAQAIAEYSRKTMGHKRYAVLYPQNNYGSELARLFKKEVKDLGGEIVKEISYPAGNTDFSSQMKLIFGIQTKEKKEGRRKIKEYIPTVEVDALYIPDVHDNIRLIVPYLEYLNIKGVQLLGSNGWNSSKLAQSGAKNVEGAVFVDGFFPASPRPGTEEFTARFREAYMKDPGLLEAQAYDCARLIISSIDRNSPVDRESIRTRLKEIKDFKGAEGQVSFDTKNEATKKLFILTFKDNRIVEAPGS